MQRSNRYIGVVLIACALPLALRLVWEMTWLTWHNGPQMVGFTLVHEFILFFLFGLLAWLALAIWIVVTAILCVFRQKTSRLDLGLILSAIIVISSPMLPQTWWSTLTEKFLGLSPNAPVALVKAASEGDLARVQYLLQKGVPASSQNSRGCSALAAAAGSKNRKIMQVLLDHNADPNGSCDGSPALLKAAEKGDLAGVKRLVDSGAQVSAHDKEGFSAYDEALFSQNKQLVQYLDSINAK